MEWLQDSWQQLVGVLVLVAAAVRIREQLSEARKDISDMQRQVERLMTKSQALQEAVTVLQASSQMERDQRKMLWDFANKLRDRQ
tara:strand:- start:2702 stop:2956 length:255 start_codon:yes stop_codon:yes gene_type:complete